MPKKPPTAHEQRQTARYVQRKAKQDRYAAEARTARKRQEDARQAASKPRSGSAKQRYRERKAATDSAPGGSRPHANRLSTAQREAIYRMLLARELLSLARARLQRLKARGLGTQRHEHLSGQA